MITYIKNAKAFEKLEQRSVASLCAIPDSSTQLQITSVSYLDSVVNESLKVIQCKRTG